MDVLHPRCCGLDVHKSSISACILLREAGRVQKHQRRFGTMTEELQELAEWLRQFGVTQIAMESSGVYWKPVWNILERQFTVVLANAQHIKNVPGRKTDQKDAEWISMVYVLTSQRTRVVGYLLGNSFDGTLLVQTFEEIRFYRRISSLMLTEIL